MRLPREDASELDFLLFEQLGVISTDQALRQMSESKMRNLVASGRWRQLTRGVMVTESGQLSREQHWWIAVLAAGPGSVLAGLAAAQAAGLRGKWRREVVDVLRGPTRSARDLLRSPSLELPAIKIHRSTALASLDLQRGRPDRTSTARSLVDAATWALSDSEAASIISAGCQQRLVTPDEITAVADRLTRVRRRVLILETARFAAEGATTPAEIDFLRLCRRARLPAPKMQVQRVDRAGATRYLDAYFAEYGVHVEIDGAHHMDVRQWAADLKRQNDMWTRGDRLLRFPAFLIRTNPDEVVAQLRAALRAAGWHDRS